MQPEAKALKMHVEIVYRTLDGFPLPARLNMRVVGSGVLNFVLDSCTVNPMPK